MFRPRLLSLLTSRPLQFLKLFHKLERKGMLLNSIYKASITLILNKIKGLTRKITDHFF